jgi:hypothetical protein
MLVAGVTAAAYGLASTYEAAYLSYFGAPPMLARVGLTTTVFTAVSILGAGWIAVAFWALNRREDLEDDYRVRVSHMVLSVAGAAYIVEFYLYGIHHWREWLPLFVFMVLSERALNYFRWSARKRKAQGLPPRTGGDGFIIRALSPWLGDEVVMLLGLLFLANVIAQSAGRAAALRQDEFLTMASPDAVVLRTYDDLVVAAHLDRKTLTVGPEYFDLSTSRSGPVTFQREKLGPLRAAPPAVSAPARAGSLESQPAPSVATTTIETAPSVAATTTASASR